MPDLLVALPLMFIADRPNILWIFAVIYGFGLGADFMLIPLMAAQLFGPNSLARVMGILLPVDSIGLTVFPFVLGVMHGQLANYWRAHHVPHQRLEVPAVPGMGVDPVVDGEAAPSPRQEQLDAVLAQ
jgi:MFS family permease